MEGIGVKQVIKWFLNIVTTMLLLLMIVLVFFTISGKLSGDGTSKIGSYQMMVVLSGSMSPAFEAGDVIVISRVEKPEFNKGEVITFKDPEDPKKIITHRITDVVKDGNEVQYRTQGDANNTEDPKLVPTVNILGEEKFHIPYLGRLIEFGKTKQGIFLLVILPGLVLIASEFRKMVRLIGEEVESKKQEAPGK
jgi:signal peptidase